MRRLLDQLIETTTSCIEINPYLLLLFLFGKVKDDLLAVRKFGGKDLCNFHSGLLGGSEDRILGKLLVQAAPRRGFRPTIQIHIFFQDYVKEIRYRSCGERQGAAREKSSYSKMNSWTLPGFILHQKIFKDEVNVPQ
jgi:hypothetical protein